MSFKVGSPARRVTPATAAARLNGFPASPARLIDTAGVDATELPTITGKRESEVYAEIGISSRLSALYAQLS